VDFFALLAHGAAAAGMVPAPAQGSTVEPVLELLAVPGFPCLDWQAVFCWTLSLYHSGITLNEQKGMIPQVGGQVVDVAPLQALLVLTVFRKAE
jgi:hypothetical protein